jgi:hypothetical protein
MMYSDGADVIIFHFFSLALMFLRSSKNTKRAACQLISRSCVTCCFTCCFTDLDVPQKRCAQTYADVC